MGVSVFRDADGKKLFQSFIVIGHAFHRMNGLYNFYTESHDLGANLLQNRVNIQIVQNMLSAIKKADFPHKSVIRFLYLP